MTYIIGIDLGTTNCTMAYALANADNPQIEQFSIPQITASGELGEALSLPSFLYFPLDEEREKKLTEISWNGSSPYCVGVFARDRGGEVPDRMISSAKSWLCHSGINRRDKLLPLHSENIEKLSPLDACANLLCHLREAWNAKLTSHPFQEQQILITVPASFDPSARQLVQEAAAIACYPEIILLEEPQAAFYAWLSANSETWRNQLSVNDTILVVDIGGGTTDFSLISVGNENGDLALQRQAVGEHLLLGGDNIDLSLAYLVKGKLESEGHQVDDWQLQALVHTCRSAKERMMSAKAPKQIDITVAGRGSRLIGGMLKTSITRDEVLKLIVDGFVPLTDPQERSLSEKRLGMQQIGLPYAQDARISCQLSKFLSMMGESDIHSMDRFVVPTAVLFNGGTMKAAALQTRLLELLNHWSKQLKKNTVKVLSDPDYDFAVSRGAVFYGFSRQGKAVRIKSGTSQSYFIGVEESVPAVPGMPVPLKAVCVVPFGMEEGSQAELEQQEFALVLGQQATFRFFSHGTKQLSNGIEPVTGTSVRNWQQELKELHPIETFLEKSESDGKTVRVKLKSHVTELGVLELWCQAEDGRKWKLEFDIRT